ncbi:MAG: hypothetical protein MUO54_13315, partial [Anaerolineales bacterium]|nr:hypothetical protein [Anaerolineales bacterium]
RDDYGPAIGALGFGVFGLILTTFRTRFTIDLASYQIFKEYRVFGLLLTKDQIRIPKGATQVIIKQKTKIGKGYIQAAVGFGYRIRSCDVYFSSEKGLVSIIHTDYERAVKIADLIKDHLGLDYILT